MSRPNRYRPGPDTSPEGSRQHASPLGGRPWTVGSVARNKTLWAGAGCLVLIGLLAGCQSLNPFPDQVTGPNYQPRNIQRTVSVLPLDLRRVALLPLVAEGTGPERESGRQHLGPVMAEELGKAQRFELISVSPDQLRTWTGRWDWVSHAELPVRFFETVRQKTGCDAVLFSRLTRYHAYPPLVIGWHWALVDASTGNLLWAADEVFDAAQPSVVAGARRFHQTQPRPRSALEDSWSILNSPLQFGHYTAATLAAALPPR